MGFKWVQIFWKKIPADRSTWRSLIHTGAKTAETNRTAVLEKKRETRKARAVDIQKTIPTCSLRVREDSMPELAILATSGRHIKSNTKR